MNNEDVEKLKRADIEKRSERRKGESIKLEMKSRNKKVGHKSSGEGKIERKKKKKERSRRNKQRKVTREEEKKENAENE